MIRDGKNNSRYILNDCTGGELFTAAEQPRTFTNRKLRATVSLGQMMKVQTHTLSYAFACIWFIAYALSFVDAATSGVVESV